MKLLEERESSLVVEVDLKEPCCPLCKADWKPEEEEKVCECGEISYRAVDSYGYLNRKTEEVLPFYNNRVPECDLKIGYIYLRIRHPNRILTLYVPPGTDSISYHFRKFLYLDDHSAFLLCEKREGKRTTLSIQTLTFWEKIKTLLLLKKYHGRFSHLFYCYLKTLGGK